MDDGQILLDLADEIRELNRRIASMNTFLTSVSSSSHFSVEELAATQHKIDVDIATRDEKAATLQRKLEVYESRVVGLEASIAERKRVIDASDPTPDLLDLFAERQAALNEDLQAARTFLRS